MSLTLHTLGPLELHGASRTQAEAILRAPKRVALLAYLTTEARGGFVRRDTLLALLWPESNGEQARRALRNLVHHIRRSLGDETIATRGVEEIGVHETWLTSDAALFQTAAAGGQDEQAVALYRGPFLNGFYAPGAAQEFQEWVDGTRRRLADLHLRSLERLAASAEQHGDLARAAELWRRAVHHDPLNTRVALDYMKVLARAGDPARALRHAEVHTTILAKELGSTPDPAVNELANQLRVGAGRTPRSRAETLRSVPAEAHAAPEPKAPPRPIWKHAAGVVAIIVLVLVGVTTIARRSAGIGFRARDYVVLADIENRTGDATLEAPAAAALSLALRQSRYLNLFPRDRIRGTLSRMGRDSMTSLSPELAREVALRESTVRAIVATEIVRVDTSYLLTGRVMEPSSGREVGVATTRAEGTHQILPALDSLARAIRHSLGESLDSIATTTAPLPYATTSSLTALRLFAAGQRAWEHGRWQEAQTLWEEAVHEDSTFAWAHASLGLAVSWLADNTPNAAEEHFQRAERLLDRVTVRERLWIRSLIARSRRDEQEAARVLDAYLDLFPDDRDGWYNLGRHRWNVADYAGAIDAFEHAIRLDPTMTNAHINLGFLHDRRGDYAAAIGAFERAIVLQPEIRTRQQGGINHRLGFLYVKVGDTAQASATFRAMLQGDPRQRADGHRSLALLDLYYGRYRAAIPHLREATLLAQSNGQATSEFRNRLYLVSAYRMLGRDDDRERELAALTNLARETVTQDFWLHRLCIELINAGRVTEARGLVDRASATGSAPRRVYQQLLLSEIDLAEGGSAKAVEQFEVAYRREPVAGIRSRLARAAHMSGNLDRAAALYEELAADRAAVGYETQEDWILSALYLGRIAEARGDHRAAVEHYGSLLRRWENADRDLPPVIEARERLATLSRTLR